MSRILLALIAMFAALIIAPRYMPPSTSDMPPQSHQQNARPSGGHDPSAGAEAKQTVEAVNQIAVLPGPIVHDLAEFATSQGIAIEPKLRGWASDLDGDGHQDLLLEADFGTDDAGRQIIYHFPYFASGETYRRGSALSLGANITSISSDGRALVIALGERSLRLVF
jgi:hypothetical protein